MTIDLNKAAGLLREKDNILILTHRNPDGDTLGSATALAHALSAKGKNRYFCLELKSPTPKSPPDAAADIVLVC